MLGLLTLSAVAVPWHYTAVPIDGFTLMVEDQAKADPVAYRLAIQEITRQIGAINRVVPDGPLAKLRQIKIYVNAKSETVCMAFHPGAEWLREHKMDPDMAGNAEIGNVANFVSWTYEQPWMILHELAHGYHFRFLEKGSENPTVLDGFRAAVDSKKYEKVLRYTGGTERHYALTNQMEYFAESTEAYFGLNDFFPFCRAELMTYDPKAFALMESIWGKPVKRLN